MQKECLKVRVEKHYIKHTQSYEILEHRKNNFGNDFLTVFTIKWEPSFLKECYFCVVLFILIN